MEWVKPSEDESQIGAFLPLICCPLEFVSRAGGKSILATPFGHGKLEPIKQILGYCTANYV